MPKLGQDVLPIRDDAVDEAGGLTTGQFTGTYPDCGGADVMLALPRLLDQRFDV